VVVETVVLVLVDRLVVVRTTPLVVAIVLSPTAGMVLVLFWELTADNPVVATTAMALVFILGCTKRKT
jgi:hypothetical protein